MRQTMRSVIPILVVMAIGCSEAPSEKLNSVAPVVSADRPVVSADRPAVDDPIDWTPANESGIESLDGTTRLEFSEHHTFVLKHFHVDDIGLPSYEAGYLWDPHIWQDRKNEYPEWDAPKNTCLMIRFSRAILEKIVRHLKGNWGRPISVKEFQVIVDLKCDPELFGKYGLTKEAAESLSEEKVYKVLRAMVPLWQKDRDVEATVRQFYTKLSSRLPNAKVPSPDELLPTLK